VLPNTCLAALAVCLLDEDAGCVQLSEFIVDKYESLCNHCSFAMALAKLLPPFCYLFPFHLTSFLSLLFKQVLPKRTSAPRPRAV